MVEVPSAALTANLIAPHVSFSAWAPTTSCSTRSPWTASTSASPTSRAHPPRYPETDQETIDIGHEHDVWSGLCGEMAGNALMTPLLVGLGVDELSVSPSLVPLVKNVVRSIYYSQAEDLARRALASSPPPTSSISAASWSRRSRRKYLI